MVKKKEVEGVPFVYAEDGYSYRFVDPAVEVNDTLLLENGEVAGFIKFEEGKLAMVVKGNNLGCIGHILRIERHEIGFDMIYLRDLNGRNFATRAKNCVVIDEEWISLPNGKGVKKSEIEVSNALFGEMVHEDAE